MQVYTHIAFQFCEEPTVPRLPCRGWTPTTLCPRYVGRGGHAPYPVKLEADKIDMKTFRYNV